jgi:hypothetical protein
MLLAKSFFKIIYDAFNFRIPVMEFCLSLKYTDFPYSRTHTQRKRAASQSQKQNVYRDLYSSIARS